MLIIITSALANTHGYSQSIEYPPKTSSGFEKLGKRLFWTGLLLGVPAGIIYVANLPYPVIRQPVSKIAPILLLPSNMAMELQCI